MSQRKKTEREREREREKERIWCFFLFIVLLFKMNPVLIGLVSLLKLRNVFNASRRCFALNPSQSLVNIIACFKSFKSILIDDDPVTEGAPDEWISTSAEGNILEATNLAVNGKYDQ